MGKGGAYENSGGDRLGLNNEYLQGLDYLRTQTANIESEMDKIKREFYGSDTNDEDKYEAYIKGVNDKLLHCNNRMRKVGNSLVVIDGQMKLVGLLNKMRALPEVDSSDTDAISSLTAFWENLKNSVDAIKAVLLRYRSNVFKRLKTMCVSYQENSFGKDIALTKAYTEQVSTMEGEISQVMALTERLLKSFENVVSQDCFTNTSFSDRILVSCDRKAFPILRVFPDLTEKLNRCCSVASQWIDKDETYVHDIHNHIRETRTQAKQKESDLRSQLERQNELQKTVEDAFNLFKTNKGKLGKLESELKVLEEQIGQYDSDKKYKAEEKKQKEGIVGFLEISISQTKKNYTLQLKRSRLMRQLRELEESLKVIEDELKSMQDELKEKSGKKELVSKRVEQSNDSYQTLKTDLDKFNKKIELLGEEVSELTDSLTHLESIETFKTSPEKVDDFYDKPSQVQLAPSLKEKIMAKKKRKLNAVNKRFLKK